MKLRSRVLLLLWAAVVGTVGTCVIADVSVNRYSEQLSQDYHWTSRGGPFLIYESHPAWTEAGIGAEWRLEPLGILLSVGFWFVVLALLWIAWHFGRAAVGPRRPAPASDP